MKTERIFLGIFIFLCILIQITLRESILFFHFEVFVIFVIILSFLTDFRESLIWSFYCGFIQDLFAGAPALGIYTFSSLILAFLINIFKDYLLLKSIFNLMIFIFLGTIVELMFTRFIYSLLFDIDFTFAASTTIHLLLPSAVNALIAIPIYLTVLRIKKIERRRLWNHG
ncbi:MAG: rod shape-determining protein MreD [bacterium]|nr:rod shape-determining protein MreD [bacterium]